MNIKPVHYICISQSERHDSAVSSQSLRCLLLNSAVLFIVCLLMQVWDVNFTIPKATGSSSNEAQEFTTIAVARLSVIVGLPDPEKGRVGNEKLIAIARKMNIELVPQVRSKL